ncbi:PIF1-like helicase [Hirsutella rhossiliensis]|uniref:ATP-dependent DNA helicase n=1 Tax=Hirsutella rhossiliensis TaxID=111463 RepID=A0A9P8MQ77_9HYPO|nr:PIF1-like helicase domain-containing protein [Hirsutella rhossiliensis]KAH0959290.1 PIF1-like helicase domain-containing protein [Hirsutella rhossiliensis]
MHLHGRLGCEHAYPDELKGLTPVEEKLISLNSCYGFVTRYSIPGGQRQSVRAGDQVLPHPLVRVMDEIHVSWQGAEKPGPRDLSGLLSVRRRAVERALVWLKENNPLYGEVEIDVAEMESWGAAARGAVVPPTERAMDDEGAVEIEEILVMLSQGRDPAERSRDVRPTCDDEEDGARPEEGGEVIDEVTSSGMFPLDGPPGVADAEKIRFARDAVGPDGARARAGPRTWVGTAAGGAARGGDGDKYEPYIQVRRGNEFADSADAANFAKVEGLLKSLTTQRLEAARVELEATGKTGDDGVKELLRSLSVFGHRQPMSRESRLSMRKKILSLIVRYGVPAIWFTLNPNDITNPVKLRLAAYRARDPEAAEAFLRELGTAYKRVRLAIADPMSAAVFFHREIKLFFEHYVDVGDESVFGHVGAYYGAVETNERGALHLHGLLWLKGNARLGEALAGAGGEEQAAYRERIIRYVDSVFSEELDAEGHHAVQAERSITAHMSSWLDDVERFTDAFDEEANFCAGATQVHTHSATCVKYSLAGAGRLRHNHDISFIATQRKTMALIYYITNYATKSRQQRAVSPAPTATIAGGTEPERRPRGPYKEQDEGVPTKGGEPNLHGAPAIPGRGDRRPPGVSAEFCSGAAWAYVNTNQLYWAVFRQWRHLRLASGVEATASDAPDETVVVEEAGPRISFIEAYRHRGGLLQGLCLYDYASLVRLKRNGGGAEGCAAWGEIPFNESWAPGRTGRNKEFGEEDEESCHRRAAVQHLALFVPWEAFVCEETGDINDIWARGGRRWRRGSRGSRTTYSCSGGRRRTPSATPGNGPLRPRRASRRRRHAPTRARRRRPRGGQVYRAGGAGDAARLIDVVRNAAGAGQVTARSAELLAMTQQLCRFQQSALSSAAELDATVVAGEAGPRRVILAGRPSPGRRCRGKSRNPGRRGGVGARGRPSAALRGVMGGFGEDDVEVTAADADAGMRVRLGPSSSFVAAGRELAGRLTLNEKQSIALLIICRQLDQARQGGDAGDSGDAGQLCLFVGGEGEDLSSQLLITATSGTAAARINGITLHSACGLLVGQGGQAGGSAREVDGVRLPGQGERFVDGRSRMDWQEKEVLVIDEVSMLGARTLHAANEQLCRLRGSPRDFGGIPVVILCGDFHQFRPVQERSILLPSAAVPWDADGAFAAERRRQHDKAHALWRKFTTVVMLDEQMRAAGDPELRRLLGRIRRGEQDRSDLDLLNSRCYRAGRRIPWETGRRPSRSGPGNGRSARIFVSEHKWRDGTPTEEEAVLMLGQGDDSATPVPAVFLFVPGMPVVVNQNTHQGLKLVNGAGYTAVDVIPDRAFPGHRVSAELTMHFGPPVGMVLASETTKISTSWGCRPGRSC